MTYILITGSRSVDDYSAAVETARSLLWDLVFAEGSDDLHFVHGAADGWDSIFDKLCRSAPTIDVRSFPASDYTSPLVRNEVMVESLVYARDLDHRVECWAFAKKWASGTGHCARQARLHHIKTIDYGVDTRDPRSPF